MPNDADIGAVMAQVVASDPDLKARVRNLINIALTEAEDIMTSGAPNLRAQLIKSALPSLIRELREERVDDRLAQVRTEMLQLNEALRAQVADPRQMKLDSAAGAKVIPMDRVTVDKAR